MQKIPKFTKYYFIDLKTHKIIFCTSLDNNIFCSSGEQFNKLREIKENILITRNVIKKYLICVKEIKL